MSWPPRHLDCHLCGNPPRNAHPVRGKGDRAGRFPDSRVTALLRLPGLVPSGILEKGSPLTVAGAVPGSTTNLAGRTGFPLPLRKRERRTYTSPLKTPAPDLSNADL